MIDLDKIIFKTSMNTAVLKNCFNAVNDIDKIKRLEKQECKTCFYIRGKIGGAMMTRHSCELCNKSIMFGSTCIDVLCVDCAKKHKLCKHCGADIEDKKRRKL